MSLISDDLHYIWHPFTHIKGTPPPVPVTRAHGAVLATEDDREIIDAISSWWVNLHGHAHPVIAQAITQQAQQLEQVIFAGFTHEPAVTLAKKLITILPDNQARVFFSDDGSTAVEVAMKMAFQYWFNRGRKKSRVIALEGAYHGDTFGSMSVGARDTFNVPFEPYLFEVTHLDFPTSDNISAVLAELRKQLATDEVAFFIYEPLVQGSAGMRMYSPELLEQMLSVAREYDVLCIADEVMTGFGRTGKLFASLYCTVQPDIICLSKGITGGFLPLGVTTCTSEVYSAFVTDDRHKTFYHGHSYTANPLSCAAANASIGLLLLPECQDNIRRIEQRHAQFIRSTEGHPAIQHIRLRGTILALELRSGEQSSYFSAIRDRLYDRFLEKNVLLRPLGNVIYVLPPYVITDTQLDTVYTAIRETLDTL